MLQIVVTGDESWCFQFDSEMKRQSMEWRITNSPQQKEVKFQQSHVKTMLIFFFYVARNIHQKFVPEGIKVYSHYYLGAMERLYMHMRFARNKQLRNNPWLLLHDNMPTHCAKCEAVSCFHIDLCDPTFPLLAIFGTDHLFFLPEGESAPKRRAFQ
jgi:hypothetical protein